MTQRGKHFTFGPPGMAGPSSRSSSAWRKGILCALVFAAAGLLLLNVLTSPHCTVDGLRAVNYLSLHVGGFSVFVRWNAFGCQ